MWGGYDPRLHNVTAAVACLRASCPGGARSRHPDWLASCNMQGLKCLISTAWRGVEKLFFNHNRRHGLRPEVAHLQHV
jgi:hypothetical protein